MPYSFMKYVDIFRKERARQMFMFRGTIQLCVAMQIKMYNNLPRCEVAMNCSSY